MKKLTAYFLTATLAGCASAPPKKLANIETGSCMEHHQSSDGTRDDKYNEDCARARLLVTRLCFAPAADGRPDPIALNMCLRATETKDPEFSKMMDTYLKEAGLDAKKLRKMYEDAVRVRVEEENPARCVVARVLTADGKITAGLECHDTNAGAAETPIALPAPPPATPAPAPKATAPKPRIQDSKTSSPPCRTRGPCPQAK